MNRETIRLIQRFPSSRIECLNCNIYKKYMRGYFCSLFCANQHLRKRNIRSIINKNRGVKNGY